MFYKNPCFIDWHIHLLKDLYIKSYSLQYRRGEIVYKEGEESNAVYLVIKGEFSVKNIK